MGHQVLNRLKSCTCIRNYTYSCTIAFFICLLFICQKIQVCMGGGGGMFVLNSMNLGQSLIILEAAWIWGHVLYGMIIHFFYLQFIN